MTRADSFFHLADGRSVSRLGFGTWRLGEHVRRHDEEAAVVRLAVEQGLRLIDTAEMYGDGATETLLGKALSGLRHDVFLTSKVYPQNAGGMTLQRACEASLRRLGTDTLDLYLLHWRGSVPLAATVEGFDRLKAQGKIRAWGVSNFDLADLQELDALGVLADCACNQVLYNLQRRGPEFDLLPWMLEKGMSFVAYSPIEQGRLHHPDLAHLAKRLGLTSAQVALAWVLRQPGVAAIPKTASRAHLAEIVEAGRVTLDRATLAALDEIFPPPKSRTALQML